MTGAVLPAKVRRVIDEADLGPAVAGARVTGGTQPRITTVFPVPVRALGDEGETGAGPLPRGGPSRGRLHDNVRFE